MLDVLFLQSLVKLTGIHTFVFSMVRRRCILLTVSCWTMHCCCCEIWSTPALMTARRWKPPSPCSLCSGRTPFSLSCSLACSLSLSLTFTLSFGLSLSLPLSSVFLPFLSFSLALSTSVCLSVCLQLSTFLPFSCSLPCSVPLSTPSLSLPLCECVCVGLGECVCVGLGECVCVCVHVCVCVQGERQSRVGRRLIEELRNANDAEGECLFSLMCQSMVSCEDNRWWQFYGFSSFFLSEMDKLVLGMLNHPQKVRHAVALYVVINSRTDCKQPLHKVWGGGGGGVACACALRFPNSK